MLSDGAVAGRVAVDQPLTVSALARSVWHDFLVARRGLFIYEVLFNLLEAWLLVPAVALVLAVILSRADHVAVSNQDILSFLLTPFGLLYAALLVPPAPLDASLSHRMVFEVPSVMSATRTIRFCVKTPLIIPYRVEQAQGGWARA
jgi:hypothetical protein